MQQRATIPAALCAETRSIDGRLVKVRFGTSYDYWISWHGAQCAAFIEWRKNALEEIIT